MIIIAKGEVRNREATHGWSHRFTLGHTYTIHTALYCEVAWKASLHTRMESADVRAGGLNTS